MRLQSATFLLLLLPQASLARRPFGVVPSVAAASCRRTEHATVLGLLRGGYQQEHDNLDQHDDGMPPRIAPTDMALALRWTAEINRRLAVGTSSRRGGADPLIAPILYRDSSSQQTPLIRGGSAATTMASTATSESPLTLFHAKSPRPGGTGASRWGPNLEAYLQHVSRQLGLIEDDDDNDGATAVELSLALLYLDRATSAETPRSNGVAACPFLTPRSVHRLALTALLLATQTTRGWPLTYLMERIESLGIPSDQLTQMLSWMQGALGDPGLFVTPVQLQTWRKVLPRTSWLQATVASTPFFPPTTGKPTARATDPTEAPAATTIEAPHEETFSSASRVQLPVA